MASQIIEATVLILVLGLILAHSAAFSAAAGAVGQLYTGAVNTLANVAGPPR